MKKDRFLTGIKLVLGVEREDDMESPHIQGTFQHPMHRWETVDIDQEKRIAKFAMCVDVKSDGRIHYTGVHARDADGNKILFNKWGSAGQWEELELAPTEMIIGVHGYIHMNWQIIHLGLLLLDGLRV